MGSKPLCKISANLRNNLKFCKVWFTNIPVSAIILKSLTLQANTLILFLGYFLFEFNNYVTFAVSFYGTR